MTDAIGYTRLSQDSDTSLENQAANIHAYADRRGFQLREIVSDGERASGFSPDELDGYQQIRELVQADAINAVITNDKRRWPRDENEVMRFVADLRDRDVELHTHLNGQVDLSDPMDAAIEIMRASVAAEEKREEIKKAREAVQQRQERGYDHGRPRFGMEYDDEGQYQRPNDNFETVEEIWQLRDDGESYTAIAEETDVPQATVYRVVQSREWYEERTLDI